MPDEKFARKIAMEILTNQIKDGLIACSTTPKKCASDLLKEKQEEAYYLHTVVLYCLKALETLGYNIIKI